MAYTRWTLCLVRVFGGTSSLVHAIFWRFVPAVAAPQAFIEFNDPMDVLSLHQCLAMGDQHRPCLGSGSSGSGWWLEHGFYDFPYIGTFFGFGWWWIIGNCWFGTMEFYDFPFSWEWKIIPTDFHSIIFRRVGGSTTNQIIINHHYPYNNHILTI